MSENSTPVPTEKDLKDEPVSIRWDDGKNSSIRAPIGLREHLDQFLKELLIESGVQFSRNQFILNAIRFYLRYLLQSKNSNDLVLRMKEEFKILDEKEDGSNIAE